MPVFRLLFLFLGLTGLVHAQKLPDLIPFKDHQLWGYCDSTFKMIIPARFTSAEPFMNGIALVDDKESENRYLIDVNGNKIPSAYNVLMRHDDGTYLLEKDGRFGLMDDKLNVLIIPKYTGIASLQGEFIELYGEKGSGIYNVNTQKWVLPMNRSNGVNEHIFGPFYGLSDGSVGMSGVFNAAIGKEIISDLTYAYPCGNDHAVLLFENGESALMDPKGNLLFKTNKRLCYPAGENRIGYTADEKKYGFMDFKGRNIMDAKYEYVFNFVNNRAVVKEGEGFGVIDTSGNWIIKPDFQVLNHWFNDFSEGILPLNKGDSTYLFDINGKTVNVIPQIQSFTGMKNQMFCVVKDLRKYAFVDKNGTFITDYKFSGPGVFENGICKVSIENPDKTLKIYYIDKYGKEYLSEN